VRLRLLSRRFFVSGMREKFSALLLEVIQPTARPI